MSSPTLFQQHSRAWQANRYVYPVLSRRAKGLSIGVNLNPDKICNFDCAYCQVDRSGPRPPKEVDLGVLAQELDGLVSLAVSGELFAHPPFSEAQPHLRRLNDVAFSGDGEPTSSKAFPAACRLAAETLRRHGAEGAKIVVITNATLLARPEVAAALDYLDGHRGEVWAKLDAGTEEYYQRVNRSVVPLAKVLENIRQAGQRRSLVIQSMFLALNGEPAPEAELAAYLARLTELRASGCRIARVQAYTVARGTAEAWATPLTRGQMDEIAARIRAQGFEAEAFYGPS